MLAHGQQALQVTLEPKRWHGTIGRRCDRAKVHTYSVFDAACWNHWLIKMRSTPRPFGLAVYWGDAVGFSVAKGR